MTEDPNLEQFLTYRLHRVARLSDRAMGAAYLATCGLNTSEARCLASIGSFAPLSVNDLAQRANQDKGQASRSTKALVDRGLVVKDASLSDGRGVVLTLTRRGRTLHARTLRAIVERNARMFATLSGPERKTLGALLDRVASALQRD